MWDQPVYMDMEIQLQRRRAIGDYSNLLLIMKHAQGAARVLSAVHIVVFLLMSQVILRLIMKIVKAVLFVWTNVRNKLFRKNVR